MRFPYSLSPISSRAQHNRVSWKSPATLSKILHHNIKAALVSRERNLLVDGETSTRPASRSGNLDVLQGAKSCTPHSSGVVLFLEHIGPPFFVMSCETTSPSSTPPLPRHSLGQGLSACSRGYAASQCICSTRAESVESSTLCRLKVRHSRHAVNALHCPSITVINNGPIPYWPVRLRHSTEHILYLVLRLLTGSLPSPGMIAS